MIDMRGKKAVITKVQLMNFVSMAAAYKNEYKMWPTMTTDAPPPDFILKLKGNARFIAMMEGKPISGDLNWNRKGIQFATFSASDLSPDGSELVDAYGNDDIVLIFDTTGKGQIPPFTMTMTTASGQAVTIHQTVPVQASAIAMSPGDGSTPVTTWDVK
jgi:hypothetical protein